MCEGLAFDSPWCERIYLSFAHLYNLYSWQYKESQSNKRSVKWQDKLHTLSVSNPAFPALLTNVPHFCQFWALTPLFPAIILTNFKKRNCTSFSCILLPILQLFEHYFGAFCVMLVYYVIVVLFDQERVKLLFFFYIIITLIFLIKNPISENTGWQLW